MSRFVSIWFCHLATDWFTLHHKALKNQPFVLREPSHGRMVIAATNHVAEKMGLCKGLAIADARAMVPELQVLDYTKGLNEKLIKHLAEWCIRFSPVVGIDPPEGVLLDASGCTHLFGGDEGYLNFIAGKLNARGYDVRMAITDTIGLSWGLARFGSKKTEVVVQGDTIETLSQLPPEALRVEAEITERLHKLGFHNIGQLLLIPRAMLRRRFGVSFLQQLNKALGHEVEGVVPVASPAIYEERMTCLEPIVKQ